MLLFGDSNDDSCMPFRCKKYKHWMKDDHMLFILWIEKYSWEKRKAFQNILFHPEFRFKLKVTLLPSQEFLTEREEAS